MFQQVSMNAMLVAVAYLCTTGTFQKVLLGYAFVSSVVYVVLVFVGGTVPVKSFISFGFMVWFFENDVLHVLFIFWMIYIVTVAAEQIKDDTFTYMIVFI